MLYRYPTEQKITAQETVAGNRRYDNYTGEELPPVPYINYGGSSRKNSGSTSAKSKGTSVKNSGGAVSAATGAGQTASSADYIAQQKRQQKLDALKALRDREKSYLGDSYKLQRRQAAASNDDAMRELYIAYMQGMRNMPQQTALWGAGGEIESLKTQHRLNYENNRAKQARQHSGILDDIQQRYNKDLWELEQNYLKQIMNL